LGGGCRAIVSCDPTPSTVTVEPELAPPTRAGSILPVDGEPSTRRSDISSQRDGTIPRRERIRIVAGDATAAAFGVRARRRSPTRTWRRR
jgi:hypothetical protein